MEGNGSPMANSLRQKEAIRVARAIASIQIPGWFWPISVGLCTWLLALYAVGLPCVAGSNEACVSFVSWTHQVGQPLWSIFIWLATRFGAPGGVAFVLGLTAPAGILAAWSAYEVRLIVQRRRRPADQRGA